MKKHLLSLTLLALVLRATSGCGPSGAEAPAAPDPKLSSLGTVEVTARLVEIPEGAIFKRDLYDYVTILKYQVLKVHRGEVKASFIYVGHYNPFKPRVEAADRHVTNVGGSVRQFQAGEVHRMALDIPIDDFYMGGIINKYFGQETGPLYFARWTDPAAQ
jgi:hypothetical protein